ncbi:MAG: NAD(+) synthase [Treponema sp.]|nr:NAD(+) synthase [Treponema sp.]
MSLKDDAIAFVKDYFEKNGNPETKAIIGISGGKDSSTVAALCCKAIGRERVLGVLMPNGVQSDIDDSRKLCDFLGIKNITVNIQDGYNALSETIKASLDLNDLSDQYRTNTPSRLRMTTLYGVAALVGNARISCNGNLSERLAGFFTLWGDGAGDFAPLANLYVSEVIQLGSELGLPDELVHKAPSDGMCGLTDEDKLGFTYDELQKVAEGKAEDVAPEQVEKIRAKINSVCWKKELLNIPSFKYR